MLNYYLFITIAGINLYNFRSVLMDDDPSLSSDSAVTIDDCCAICGSSHDGDLHVPEHEHSLNQGIHDLLAIAEDRLAKNHSMLRI